MPNETFVFLLKPDAMIRRYVGARVLKEVMRLNPRPLVFRQMRLSRSFLEDVHYVEHNSKDFFDFLIDYVSTNQTGVIIFEGDNLVSRVRQLLGPTKPEEAAQQSPHSLRARYGIFGGINCAHASESPQVGETEVNNFRRHLGLLDESQAVERINSYIDCYIDWPYIDTMRYREISYSLTRGEITRKVAAETFYQLLAKESTNHSKADLEKMADVMVKNCLRNNPKSPLEPIKSESIRPTKTS